MEDKFQQVYDYLRSQNMLSEQSTPDSFRELYTTGEGNIQKLYSLASTMDDFPVELSSMEQFQTDLFGPVKKKESTGLPQGFGGVFPSDTSQQEFPSVEDSTASISPTAQPQAALDGGLASPENGRAKTRFETVMIGTTPFRVPVKYFDEEPNFIGGIAGDILNSGIPGGDMVDDMMRAFAKGYANTEQYDEIRFMMAAPSEESVNAFFQAKAQYDADIKRYGESSESKAFAKTKAEQQEKYGEWFGTFVAMAEHPSAVMEELFKSMAGMIDLDIARMGAEMIGIGAEAGILLTAPGVPFTGGTSVVAGGLGGAARSIPFAMARMGGEVEFLNSQIDFLKEEVESAGYEFTPDGVLAVLTDDEAYKRIRNKSVARKNSITMVDAFFGSVMSSSLRSARLANKVTDVGVVAIEATGDVASGMTGETLAQVTAGQEISPEAIVTEGFTGTVNTPTNLASTYLGMQGEKRRQQINFGVTNPRRYLINNEAVSKEIFLDFIETSSPQELMNATLKAENDVAVGERLYRMSELATVELGIPESIQGADRTALVDLELRKLRLEGKNTRPANRNRQEIDAEIDVIMDRIEAERKEQPAPEQTSKAEAETESASKKLNLSEYDLFEDKNTGEKYRKIERGGGPEGTSRYVKDGTDVYMDEDGVLRPSADEKSAMSGETLGDSMMKLIEEGKPEEAPQQPKQVVYHVTIRDNKESIQEKGLEKDRPPTFARGILGTDVFDTAGKSFVFSNLEEATKWSAKTKIEKEKEVSIVAVNAEGKNFQEDKSLTQDPFYPLSSALFTEDVISPDDILSIEDVTVSSGKILDKDGNLFTEESFGQLFPEAPKPTEQPVQPGEPASTEAVVSQAEIEANQMSDAERADAKAEQERKNREVALELRRKALEEDLYRGEKRTVKGFIADVFMGRTGFQRRMFSARRFMPRSMYRAMESKDAAMAVHFNRLEKTIARFESLEQSIPEPQRDAFYNEFNTYITGGEKGNLSPEAIRVADEMRSEIDNLSLDLVNSGVVKASSVDAVISNFGSYMNTAYRNFEGKEWAKQLKSEEGLEIVNRAKNYIKTTDVALRKKAEATVNDPTQNTRQLSLEDWHDALIQGEIESYLTNEDRTFSTEGKIGTEKEGILKQKKDLPPEIRALLGEYTDPVQNYVKTIYKMASLAEARRFNNSITEVGRGVFLFDNAQPGFSARVEVGDNVFYTSKEIASELYPDKAERSPGMDLVLKFVGGAKWAKTIGSVGTHSKNVLGNFGIMVANGHTNPLQLGERATDVATAFNLLYNDFKGLDRKDLQKKLEYYISLGIVKQNVGIGELNYLFNEKDFESAAAARLDSSGKKWLKGKKKDLENLYQAEDDFFKIMAFESEQRRYSRAMFGVDPSELTDQQRQQIDVEVAEIIKNTMPTYSRVPQVINFLKANPLIGNFVSFQAESYRISWNIIAQARKEMGSDNPDVQAIGRSRMRGAAAYMGAKHAIIGTVSTSLGFGAQGIGGELFSSEQEKEREASLRNFVPFWSQNSKLMLTSYDREKAIFSYRDFSASDPFGGMDKVTQAYANGDTMIEGFGKAMLQVIEPFTGMDIASRRVMNLVNGVDDYGKRIWFDDDTDQEKVDKSIVYLLGVFEPGTITSVRRVFQSDRPVNELVGQFTGYKEVEVDVAKAMGFKLRDHKEAIQQDVGVRFQDLDRERPLLNEDAYNKANEMLQRREALIREDIQHAVNLGMSKNEIAEMMRKQLNISDERLYSIMTGDYKALDKVNPFFEFKPTQQ